MFERMSHHAEAHAENLDELWLKERPIIEAANAKALEVFAEGEEINPRSFTHFDPEMIKRDLEYVKTLEGKFAAQETPSTRRAQLYATAFEGLIHEQVELNEWLGPDAVTRKASKYDDYVNGVDTVAEFPQDTGRTVVALSLDVTFTRPEKKLERIEKEIREGTLGKVKYFESSDEQFQGSLSLVPRVVIGADPRNIARVAALWTERKQKQLAEDPMQIQILQEIILQLKTFRAYAMSQHQQRIVDRYDQALALVMPIYLDSDKQDLRRRASTIHSLQNDKFFTALPGRLKDVFGKDAVRTPTTRTGPESLVV